MTAEVTFLPCGDTGLSVQLGHVIDRDLSHRIVRLGRAVVGADIPGIVEAVPTYCSLLVHYDPLVATRADLIDRIRPMIGALDEGGPSGGTAWRLPVCFDGPDYAPDLPVVADWAGMTVDEVVSDMTAAPLYVYMIGFAPGQPYLGDLPDRMAIPRREDPVSGVAAGCVVVATGKAVIYSIGNPTGWYVVGRTPAQLFDPAQSSPSLLAAGDSVS
ncbi:MAG: allophanate hydrolase subunit 1, partial [Pseudomonadales bacterium]|nr:allophanate hydrolase subunit 1 [Pseudomonadales bacterium]